MTQEDGKDNSYYKFALDQSRQDFTDPVGILGKNDKSPFSDPASIGDKIMIRQNNVMMYLMIEQLKILSRIERKLEKQSENLEIESLVKELRNIRPIEPKKISKLTKAPFAVWDSENYGK